MAEFHGIHASVTLRKAIRRAGLSTVGSYMDMEDRPDWYHTNETDRERGEICAVAYGPGHEKEVTILWSDMWLVEQYYQDTRPARYI